MNPNKWISTSDSYPPDGLEVEIMIEDVVCRAKFKDTEDYRSWEMSKEDYKGFKQRPTAWRFPEGTLGIVIKLDIENETYKEIGVVDESK